MESLFALGKEILLVPIWALIQAPFLRFSAKLSKASSISFKAAFILGLIASAAGLVASLALYPFYAFKLIGDSVAETLSFVAAIIILVWLYGYFLRGESGESIGARRGFIVLTLQVLLLLGFFAAVGGIIVFIGSFLS